MIQGRDPLAGNTFTRGGTALPIIQNKTPLINTQTPHFSNVLFIFKDSIVANMSLLLFLQATLVISQITL